MDNEQATSKTCPTCKGKGRWQVKETYGDGDTALVWYECGNCHGTGRNQDPMAGDDFDIGGSSLDEDN